MDNADNEYARHACRHAYRGLLSCCITVPHAGTEKPASKRPHRFPQAARGFDGFFGAAPVAGASKAAAPVAGARGAGAFAVAQADVHPALMHGTGTTTRAAAGTLLVLFRQLCVVDASRGAAT